MIKYIFFVELNLRGCLDNYKEKLVGMCRY